ncbi:MAG: PDZ domain-containing protein [Planctomycetales bacterium]|nr:PDZ domain-containing protein [Planctomycetales bacterium]
MNPSVVTRLSGCAALVAWLACGVAALADDPKPADPAAEKKTLLRGTLLAPKAFRAAAKKIQSSLVTIEGFGGLAAGSGQTKGIHAPGEGPTTGLVISSDGYIVTSTFNFIRKPPIIAVRLPSGERKIARLLGRDETRRICLLKVDGVNGLAVPEMAPREELAVGQWAVALGIGYGDAEPALTAGIISATSRIGAKAVQTDANLSPANYGGPLIDLDGRVIGICVPLSPGGQQEGAGSEWYDSGIGFAVPLTGLDKVIAAMKEGKTLQKGFLGVQSQPTGTPPTGASIVSVVPDSPAAKAGLVKDDKLLKLDDTEIIDVTHLSSVIARYVAGDKVELTYQRGEEKKTVTIELAVAPPPAPPVKPMPPMDPAKKPEEKPGEKPAEEKPAEKPAEKPGEKPAEPKKEPQPARPEKAPQPN